MQGQSLSLSAPLMFPPSAWFASRYSRQGSGPLTGTRESKETKVFVRPGGTQSPYAKDLKSRPSLGWEHFLDFSDLEQALWTRELEPGEGLGSP